MWREGGRKERKGGREGGMKRDEWERVETEEKKDGDEGEMKIKRMAEEG